MHSHLWIILIVFRIWMESQATQFTPPNNVKPNVSIFFLLASRCLFIVKVSHQFIVGVWHSIWLRAYVCAVCSRQGCSIVRFHACRSCRAENMRYGDGANDHTHKINVKMYKFCYSHSVFLIHPLARSLPLYVLFTWMKSFLRMDFDVRWWW